MDIDSSIVASAKYWFGIICSSILSYTLYAYKKHVKRMEILTEDITELKADQRVTDVEIKTIKDDIIEIKETLKQILHRL